MATAAKLLYSHITKDHEVCGGRATIAQYRLRVGEMRLYYVGGKEIEL